MSKDRKFVNPLTRPSEKGEQIDTPTFTDTSTSTYTSTDTDTAEEHQPIKRKDKTFEQLHERMTAWVDKDLKGKFEKLVKRERSSKTALLNEAINDLLKKYQNR